jgi:Zn finger protein HypA/HybF involved in hydrogenase expression
MTEEPLTNTLLHFYCKKCQKQDKIPPKDIGMTVPACPRCGEKQEYINDGYGFKENQDEV